MARMQIAPPDNWQDFEVLCRDLWSRIWDDDSAQRHGREGQPQRGVDIFGRPGRGASWAGVQCKLKSQLLGGRLGKAEIETEVEKARSFNPRLAAFILATTAPRDAATQQTAREITEQHAASGNFSVAVFAWEDISERLEAHADVLAQHYPHLGAAGGGSSLSARREYLEELWERLLPVQLLGVGRGADRVKDVPLVDVYTALDVTAEMSLRGAEGIRTTLDMSTVQGIEGNETAHVVEVPWNAGGSPAGGQLGSYRNRLEARLRQEAEARKESQRQQPYRRRWTALETMAASARLVLLGPAGSGKSTFARHLALCMVGQALGRAEANLDRLEGWVEGKERDPELAAWPHGAVLPVFVELKQLVRSGSFPAAGEEGTAGHLLAFLDDPGPERQEAGPLLREAFRQEGGALLILDGLDETPAAKQCRKRLHQLIAAFCLRFPNCQVLVTCRPYAYEADSPWRLDGQSFQEASLAPFDVRKTRAFISGWYAHLARRKQLAAEQARRQGEALWREIESSNHLKALAETPLLLTMMADLHGTSGGRLPGGRAGLYEQSVELLLDRWNEVRDVLGGESVSGHLGLTVEQLRKALEWLAYEIHGKRGAGGDKGAAEIAAAELWQALDGQRPRPLAGRVDERLVMDYLHQRSGILVAESEDIYRFPHRSFQEYLAACHLVRTGFPDLLSSVVTGDPALWREVLLLAAGRVAKTPFTVWALLEELVPAAPGYNIEREDGGFLLSLYAALAVSENELWQDVEDRDAVKLERIRQWLQRSLELGALSPADRAAGGRVLAVLGDQRPGVGLRADGVPDIEWVEVPAGRFPMGSSATGSGLGKPEHEVELRSFSISRYPVTHSQYQAFVDDGGYTEVWRDCWSDATWKWKGERQQPDDLQVDFSLSNLPRVCVSWFEAVAFCGWLGRQLGVAIHLPTEAQWEAVARGTDGRAYPWGEEPPSKELANYASNEGETMAVGFYLAGAGPYGTFDQAGNVWEWCLDEFDEHAYRKRDGDKDPVVKPKDESDGAPVRVLRGGSWAYSAWYLHAAIRLGLEAGYRNLSIGFRVCLSGPER